MELLPPLINDLGLILITAAISVVLFKILKQPLVLGYIIAGYLAGPYFSFFPTVQDPHSIEVWAEIGVIFLLFSLGLEFSFKKLMKVGGSALITGGVHIVFMLVAGFFTGILLNWTIIDSIFLGAMLSMSSTTIILRAFDEMNLKGKKFVSVVFGALIIEDIVAILLMVLLTTISVSKQFAGEELLFSFLKLSFFLIIWFLVGIFFIPTLLRKTKKHLNDEMLLILSLGLCLLMVILGYKAGFSPALGAFVMGSIIAETIYSEKIEHLIEPVKNLFGAIFFVSVGMMINPSALVNYFIPVVVITLVVIFGKIISTTAGALLAGQPLKQSVQTGMSHAQIGEFSFIIATLGMSLGVISDFIYPVIVAVSAITTFTTPYFIIWTDRVNRFLEHFLPKKVKRMIDRYSANTQKVKTQTAWQIVLRANVTHIILITAVVVAIILISSSFTDEAERLVKNGGFILAFLTLLSLLPFLWALAFRRLAVQAMQELRLNRKFIGPVSIIILFRMILALLVLGFYISSFFSWQTAIIAFLLIVVLLVTMPKKIQLWYQKLENHFLKNLNSRDANEAIKGKSHLTPWDGHMTKIIVPQESGVSGYKLGDLELREKFGINIAIIKRGEISIYIPTKTDILYPSDELYIIGSDNQINAFSNYLKETLIATLDLEEQDIALKNIELKKEELYGKNIRESRIKELTGGMVVGIERDGRRILNPQSDFILRKGDIIWIVGEVKKMKLLTGSSAVKAGEG